MSTREELSAHSLGVARYCAQLIREAVEDPSDEAANKLAWYVYARATHSERKRARALLGDTFIVFGKPKLDRIRDIAVAIDSALSWPNNTVVMRYVVQTIRQQSSAFDESDWLILWNVYYEYTGRDVLAKYVYDKCIAASMEE